MNFYTPSTSVEAIKDRGESKLLFPASGVYDDIVIDTVRVFINEKGARHLHLKLKKDNKSQYLFNTLKLDNNDGTPNFQANLFDKLCAILGITSVDMPEEVSRLWLDRVQKKETLQDINVLTQFDEAEISVGIRIVYSEYNGDIQQNWEIENFYRNSDKATAEEIISDLEKGKRYKKDQELITDKYNNNLTIDDVQAWKDKTFNKNKEENTTTNSTKPLSSPFQKAE